MPKQSEPLPDWEHVLSAAAHLQRIVPDTVLVGGTASAIHAQHRFSRDADQVLTDLRTRFDDVLATLESVAGWQTARINRPVLILGSLDGIETGLRQLIRAEPLETTTITIDGQQITIPTQPEILRIKAALILKRNATRDYLDFVALADHMGDARVGQALVSFDRLYPQPNKQSALLQLQVQLASPLPFDLDDVSLPQYKNLAVRWQDWSNVKATCGHVAASVFEHVCRAREQKKP